ncbi:MAG TPA: hypothetical protein ENF48_01330 [Desulfobacteraceae bacterium]|nr:hypothetical protein [Deltaproteobacteria bacterium]MBW2356186.1 hypothetical protein [Deltaproteobacteria bacterium]RLB97889.1 MAG: hypothetical protein DRH76_03890 [Deltaproteobacteria bacterium]HDI58994.1 hypothetical protein [Desulfobacteraceae bacterium]
MSHTLLYRLFRIGRLPRRERDRLTGESLRCLVEGISLTIAWRNFRQGRRRIKAHQQNATGAVAITQKRLLVYAFAKPVLDIDLADPVADRVAVTCPNSTTLSIRLEAQDFHPDASGQITYWLLTPEAAALSDLWQNRPRTAAGDCIPA